MKPEEAIRRLDNIIALIEKVRRNVEKAQMVQDSQVLKIAINNLQVIVSELSKNVRH